MRPEEAAQWQEKVARLREEAVRRIERAAEEKLIELDLSGWSWKNCHRKLLSVRSLRLFCWQIPRAKQQQIS